MEDLLTHELLKAKQRDIRAAFPETMGLRVHRSISWIGRAEGAEDDDARFIFLWIAFNAAYADEEVFRDVAPAERTAISDFFQKVVPLDVEHQDLRRDMAELFWTDPGPHAEQVSVQPILAASQRSGRA